MSNTSQKEAAQHRLLVATAVLSFIYYAGAKIQGLSVGGANVTFANETAVLEFTWFIWFYYYLRCYQYYKKLGVKTFREALNSSYIESFGHRLVKLERHEFDLLPDDDSIKSSTIRIGWGTPSVHDFRASRRLTGDKVNAYATRFRKRRALTNLIRPPRPFARIVGHRSKSLGRLLYTLRHGSFRAVIYPPTSPGMMKGQDRSIVRLPIWMPILVLVVYLRTAIARPEFIENQGPLLLGLIPVWYVIALNWHNAALLYR